MRPSVRRIEETYQDQIDFHVLNVDDLSTQPLLDQYQVQGIPTIVLLNAQGEVVNILLGYQTEDQLVAQVEALLDNHQAQ
jgi:thioredoxin-related protein